MVRPTPQKFKDSLLFLVAKFPEKFGKTDAARKFGILMLLDHLLQHQKIYADFKRIPKQFNFSPTSSFHIAEMLTHFSQQANWRFSSVSSLPQSFCLQYKTIKKKKLFCQNQRKTSGFLMVFCFFLQANQRYIDVFFHYDYNNWWHWWIHWCITWRMSFFQKLSPQDRILHTQLRHNLAKKIVSLPTECKLSYLLESARPWSQWCIQQDVYHRFCL